MQFEERYELDEEGVRAQWQAYVQEVHRGVIPRWRTETCCQRFNHWLQMSGRKTVPLAVFRRAQLGRRLVRRREPGRPASPWPYAAV